MYENIPGMSLEIKDGGLVVPIISGYLTDKVLIIGNAVDGPIGRPVRVNSATAEMLFGPVVYDDNYAPSGTNKMGRYNGNNLVKAYNEVALGGCADVLLMRVGGESAASVNSTTAGTGIGLEIKGMFPGSIYNGIEVELYYASDVSLDITDAKLVVKQSAVGKGNDLTYTLIAGGVAKTNMDVITEVNGDPANRSVILTLPEDGSYVSDILADFTVAAEKAMTDTADQVYTLVGGKDGTRNDGTYDPTKTFTYDSATETYTEDVAGTYTGLTRLYKDLTKDEYGSFAMLQSVIADIVYLPCLYFDEAVGQNTETNGLTAGTGFAAALHRATASNYPMVGVMGMTPLTNVSRTSIASAVFAMTASTAATDGTVNPGYYMAQEVGKGTRFAYTDPTTGYTVDAGRYLQLVAGPDVVLYHPDLGSYIDTPAGIYAGLISTLPMHRAATNMRVPGVRGVVYEYTNDQVNKLAGGQPWDTLEKKSGKGGAYVVLRRNNLGDLIINLDNTCAERESDYAHYQVLDIVNKAASEIRRIVTPFLGESSTESTRMAIRNAIKSFLETLAEGRAIAGGENIGYEFDVKATGLDQLLGRVIVVLTIRPALQIKSVRVFINVAPPLGN